MKKGCETCSQAGMRCHRCQESARASLEFFGSHSHVAVTLRVEAEAEPMTNDQWSVVNTGALRD